MVAREAGVARNLVFSSKSVNLASDLGHVVGRREIRQCGVFVGRCEVSGDNHSRHRERERERERESTALFSIGEQNYYFGLLVKISNLRFGLLAESEMSTLCSNKAMGSPLFGDMRRQTTFFLKEKLRSARLAFTDVTPAELMTEEVTNGSPWAPDVCAMGLISKAAFEIGDYWRIVEVLHKRLANFDKKNWRQSYQALVLLEYLLTHGPESVSRSDKEVIKECGRFQYIDERGFNWGLPVRNKSDRILKFLGERKLLKEERQRARKLSLEIRGFGSFSHKSSNSETQGCEETGNRSYQRCNFEFSGYGVLENSASMNSSFTEINESRSSSEFSADSESPASSDKSSEIRSIIVNGQRDESNCMAKIKDDLVILNKIGNLEASEDRIPEKHCNDWDQTQESQPLLQVQKEETVAPMDCVLHTHPKLPSFRSA